MSIASQLTALEGNISDAYDMVAQRGGTVPARKNMENLDDAIATIPSGSSTTITPLSVTENGTYTAPTGTAYSPVTVNVSGGESIGIPREVSSGGMYRMPADNFTFSLPANAKSIGPNALYYAFNGCTRLTSVGLSSLTRVTGSNALSYAFNGCTGLTSVDLSSLTTVPGSNALANAFNGCTSLTSVDLSSLTGLTGPNALSYAFNNCTGLTSVDFGSLATVSGSGAFNYAFRNCSSLTSVSFPALTTSSFGSKTNQFYNMLYGVKMCTVHFPAAIQEKIKTMTGYPNFGGTNTTVLFDL